MGCNQIKCEDCYRDYPQYFKTSDASVDERSRAAKSARGALPAGCCSCGLCDGFARGYPEPENLNPKPKSNNLSFRIKCCRLR